MTDGQEANPTVLAGAFAANAICEYLNEIQAASYGQVPADVGGPAYVFLKEAYERILEDSDSSSPEEVANFAIARVRELVSSEAYRDSEAHMRFSVKNQIIERVLSGERLADIYAELQPEEDSTQMPEDPSGPV